MSKSPGWSPSQPQWPLPPALCCRCLPRCHQMIAAPRTTSSSLLQSTLKFLERAVDTQSDFPLHCFFTYLSAATETCHRQGHQPSPDHTSNTFWRPPEAADHSLPLNTSLWNLTGTCSPPSSSSLQLSLLIPFRASLLLLDRSRVKSPLPQAPPPATLSHPHLLNNSPPASGAQICPCASGF